MLVGADVSVWFSDGNLRLGADMRVVIESCLVGSRMGIVLVTPAIRDEPRTDPSVANAELSALFRRDLLMPVMHGVTFEELDQVGPTLASRRGSRSAEEPMGDIVVKIAELVGTLADDEADELRMKAADK